MPLLAQRRQWRGLERALLVKLRNSIVSMVRRDDRLFLRAQEQGVAGYYFAQTDTDPVYLAMQTLLTRINQCLNAKV